MKSLTYLPLALLMASVTPSIAQDTDLEQEWAVNGTQDLEDLQDREVSVTSIERRQINGKSYIMTNIKGRDISTLPVETLIALADEALQDETRYPPPQDLPWNRGPDMGLILLTEISE